MSSCRAFEDLSDRAMYGKVRREVISGHGGDRAGGTMTTPRHVASRRLLC